MNHTTLKGISWVNQSDNQDLVRVDNERLLRATMNAAAVEHRRASTFVTSVNVVCTPRSGDRPGARMVLSRMLVITRDDNESALGSVSCTLAAEAAS